MVQLLAGALAVGTMVESSGRCLSFLSSSISDQHENFVELGWMVLKKMNAPHMRSGNVRELLRVVCGSPEPGEVAAQERRGSFVGKQLLIIDQTVGEVSRASKNYRRDNVLDRLLIFSDEFVSNASFLTHVVKDGAALGLGVITLGASNQARWRYSGSLSPDSPAAADVMDESDAFRLKLPLHSALVTEGRDDSGRGNKAKVEQLVGRARSTGAADAAPPVARVSGASPPEFAATATDKVFSSTFSEFPLLSEGGRMKAKVKNIFALFFDSQLLGALTTASLPSADSHVLQCAASNLHAVNVLGTFGWPLIVETDWSIGDGSVPNVAFLYVVTVQLTARDWMLEATRVIDNGEGVSKMSKRLLSWDYKVALNELRPLAAALVEAGRGDELLAFSLIDQENAGANVEPRFRGSDAFSAGTKAGDSSPSL